MATLSPVISEYVDAYAKTQSVVLTTVEAWAEQAYSGFQSALSTTDGKLPTLTSVTTIDPVETVDAVFEQITKGLELQKSLFLGIAEATAPLFQRVVTDTNKAVETFTAQATEAAAEAANVATAATAAATGTKKAAKPASRARKS